MVSIINISQDNITIMYGENCRGVYSNTEPDRDILKSILESNESLDLWESDILPVWTNTPTVELPEPPLVDLDILKSTKQQEIKQMCHDKIVEGISIDLGLTDEEGNPLGTLHYTLSEKSQTDMRDLINIIATGATQVTWRDDSRVSHMIYTAQQFMMLYQASMNFILECRFHSDGLEELLFSYGEDDRALIEAITWDTELPEDIQSRMDSLLSIMINDTTVTNTNSNTAEEGAVS